MLINPRSGFMKRLLKISKNDTRESLLRTTLFTGLHGTSSSLESYETVVMIVSEFSIVAQLSYLKQLIYDHNTYKTQTRRVYLI